MPCPEKEIPVCMLHGKFGKVYDEVAGKADEIAERILTLGGMPEHRFSE